MKKIFQTFLVKSLTLCLFMLMGSLTFASSVRAEWTNVCGSGFAANWTGRDGVCSGCDRNSMSCSDSYVYVYKFVCHGWTRECGGGGTQPFAGYGPSSYQAIVNEQCNTTIQIDVFAQPNYQVMTDYMVWYTGPCPTAPPPPPPTATPTPTATPSPTKTPTPTATPSPTKTPIPTKTPTSTPTPTQPAHLSSCDDLRVIAGDGAVVPAKVTFEAQASDSEGEIQLYRFYFGDSQSIETTSNTIEHTYEVSGTFYPRVYIKDSRGNWKTSSSCATKLKVEPMKIETHKSGCSDLFILSGQHTQAPTDASFQVIGYDNKGAIQAYRLVYADQEFEQTSNIFQRHFSTAGSYEIRAYIKDSLGNWKGGDGSCRKTLYVETKPIVYQPKTGTPLAVTLGSVGSGVLGLVLKELKKRWV